MVCTLLPTTRLVSCGPRKRNQGQRKLCVKKKKKRRRCRTMKNVRFSSHDKVDTIPGGCANDDVTTWLSPKEFAAIRQEVELTIFLQEQGPPDANEIMVAQQFCSRGLEEYCSPHIVSTSNMANCLKTEVLLRRKLVISAVLQEQETQRRNRKQERTAENDESTKKNQQQEKTNQRPNSSYDDIALRNACLSRNNRDNVMRGIERGLKDADEARSIYKEWAKYSTMKRRRRWK